MQKLLQKKLISFWMEEGVKFVDSSSCTISDECKFGRDVVVEPETHLRGVTKIGDNCTLGPNSFIENSTIGKEIVLLNICYCKIRSIFHHRSLQFNIRHIYYNLLYKYH